MYIEQAQQNLLREEDKREEEISRSRSSAIKPSQWYTLLMQRERV